jgi:hypothetical protein
MNKFFYSLVILISLVATVNAQTVEQKTFLAGIFPKDMPDHVLKNTKIVPVTAKYAKKHNDVYLHDDLQGGNVYPGYVREGDTLLVFNGQPYFSKGQGVFMKPVPEQNTAKAPKQKRAPRTAEQKQQDNQMVSQGVNILTNIVLPTVLKRNNVSYTGGNWAGASLPTGRN